MRALMVAAPRSGSGKTTVTLAILAALRRRGVRVRAAKTGPDFIDPAFHAAATGAPCPNLDSWAMPPELLAATMPDAELVVIESAMGLFDGIDGPPGRTGAAADIAAQFGIPVLLVLDVSGQSQSAAAVARGFATHDPAVRVGGVVLNRVASARHRSGAAGAVGHIAPVLGAMLRDPALSMPERHLGLVQAQEQALTGLLDRLAEAAEAQLDLDAIVGVARPLKPVPCEPVEAGGVDRSGVRPPPPGQRIALAQDRSFTFAYAHLLDAWRNAGAEIVTFSPLADQSPPDDCDVCWLPGGYPELHAGALAASDAFLAGLRRFAQTRPVHGECGGYMVLGSGLIDADGTRHAMAGLLDHSTSFAQRRMQLGYRQATLLADGPAGRSGAVLRGHEFHYASVSDAGHDLPFANVCDASGTSLGAQGGQRGRVSGSFFHAIASLGLGRVSGP